VLVSSDKEYNHKQTFLCKIPRMNIYYTENKKRDNVYNDWKHCIKYKEPERKPRELRMTDEEYEEFKKKNNIQ